MKNNRKPNHAVRPGESPEEALFRNVIVQALADATAQRLSDYQSASAQAMQVIRGEARRWFKLQTEDFKTVCTLAGLEWQRVHQFAMTKIRESIERENARTAELLTSAMPGVVSNFQMDAQDRPPSDTRDGEKIGFSQNESSPS